MQRGRPAVLVRGALANPRALMTEPELLDERAIRRQVAALEILEETATRSDHLQQPPAAMVVLGVGAEMVGERVDPLREERDLDPGRAGVGFVPAVLDDHGLLVERHAAEFLGDSSCFSSMLAWNNNLQSTLQQEHPGETVRHSAPEQTPNVVREGQHHQQHHHDQAQHREPLPEAHRHRAPDQPLRQQKQELTPIQHRHRQEVEHRQIHRDQRHELEERLEAEPGELTGLLGDQDRSPDAGRRDPPGEQALHRPDDERHRVERGPGTGDAGLRQRVWLPPRRRLELDAEPAHLLELAVGALHLVHRSGHAQVEPPSVPSDRHGDRPAGTRVHHREHVVGLGHRLAVRAPRSCRRPARRPSRPAGRRPGCSTTGARNGRIAPIRRARSSTAAGAGPARLTRPSAS